MIDWLLKNIVQEVPVELSVCEFDCPYSECTDRNWAKCTMRPQIQQLGENSESTIAALHAKILVPRNHPAKLYDSYCGAIPWSASGRQNVTVQIPTLLIGDVDIGFHGNIGEPDLPHARRDRSRLSRDGCSRVAAHRPGKRRYRCCVSGR